MLSENVEKAAEVSAAFLQQWGRSGGGNGDYDFTAHSSEKLAGVRAAVRTGRRKLLYVTPERLESSRLGYGSVAAGDAGDVLQASGVGQVKAERYGTAFLEATCRWKAEQV